MSDFIAQPESSSSPHRQSSQMQRSPSSGRSPHRHHHRRSHREGIGHQSRSQMLEFNSAMSNFASMFPTLDTDVIESVLRANRGVVEPTIDQLIAMTATEENAPPTRAVHSPPVQAQRSLDEDFATFTRTATRTDDVTDGIGQRADAPPALPPKTSSRTHRRQEVVDRSRTSTTGLRAPLVGPLPDDFLRIVPDDVPPQSMSSLIEDTRAAVAASNTATMLSTATAPTSRSDGRVPLKFLTSTSEAQLAEDERIALYFQNAEFMSELRRNRDFIQQLERDRASMARDRGGYIAGDEEDTHVLVYPGYFSNSERKNPTNEPKPLPVMVHNETMERTPKKKDRPRSIGEGAVGETTDSGAGTLTGSATRQVGNEDMAAFQHRLRHMGQSTRKKFFQLAKKFQRHRGTMNLNQAVAGSTLQLIDDDSDEAEEQRAAARMFSPEKSKELGNRLEFVPEWPAQESKNDDNDDDDELLDVNGIELEISPRTQEPGAHNEPIIFFADEDRDLPLGTPSTLGESRA